VLGIILIVRLRAPKSSKSRQPREAASAVKAHDSSVGWEIIAVDGLLALAWHRTVGRRQMWRSWSCRCASAGRVLGGDLGVAAKVRTGAEDFDGIRHCPGLRLLVCGVGCGARHVADADVLKIIKGICPEQRPENIPSAQFKPCRDLQFLMTRYVLLDPIRQRPVEGFASQSL
jgi:hypothetical protein